MTVLGRIINFKGNNILYRKMVNINKDKRIWSLDCTLNAINIRNKDIPNIVLNPYQFTYYFFCNHKNFTGIKVYTNTKKMVI